MSTPATQPIEQGKREALWDEINDHARRLDNYKGVGDEARRLRGVQPWRVDKALDAYGDERELAGRIEEHAATCKVRAYHLKEHKDDEAQECGGPEGYLCDRAPRRPA